MSDEPSASIQPQQQQFSENNHNRENTSSNTGSSNHIAKKQRPSRACTARAAARLYEAAAAEAAVAAAVRKKKKKKKAKKEQLGLEKSPEPSSPPPSPQCKIITPLVGEPLPSQLPRWSLRSMSELASILNFLNIFRPLLNIKVEFSAEELETALIAPNNTLATIHVPLLKAIPPITRTALGHKTWITVLCRKLRDWWHWVAEGDLPIVASHGAEIEAYNALDPGVRVLILKALCDIRVEQEDIRTHIDNSIKDGAQLSAFRKARIGGDSYGVSYWYEDDPLIGHRLYREIRKVEVKEVKGKHAHPIPSSSYQWETVATNLDEFEDVSEKLFSSENRTETSLGKKMKIDMLPEVEKVHKRKEKLLKKQHRQALLLENMMNLDGFAPGRSLRDRKPVTYTFDEYDRSINEAIKITKQKQPSPEPSDRRESTAKPDASINAGCIGHSQIHLQNSFDAPYPKSFDFDDYDMDHKPELLHRSDRQRQRPQRYSAKEFVQAVSDNDADFGSDDDIVGEAVFDEDYTRQRKQRKTSTSSEGDEEYHWDEENAEDEQLEEDDDSLSASEDSDDGPQRLKKLPAGRTRRETKLLSVDGLQSGLRRSKRATKNGINYKQFELSESEADSMKPEKSHVSDEHTDSDNAEFSMESQDSEGNNDGNHQIREVDQPETLEKVENQPLEKSSSTGEKEIGGLRKTRFLDLNELAPGSGFEDDPNAIKYEDADDF